MNIVPFPIDLPPGIGELLGKLFSAGADELGLVGRDIVRQFRFNLQLRYFQKLKQKCEAAHIQVGQVKLPLLLDVINWGAVEEDEDLQELWVNLLANAADVRQTILVRKAFPEILRQISKKEDAVYLSNMYEIEKKTVGYVNRNFPMAAAGMEPQKPALDEISYDNLKRLGLIEPSGTQSPVEDLGVGKNQYRILSYENDRITALGSALIEACQPPKSYGLKKGRELGQRMGHLGCPLTIQSVPSMG